MGRIYAAVAQCFPKPLRHMWLGRQRSRTAYELDADIEVLVVSPGGVGTTMLINYLSNYKKCNHNGDRDGYKHRPFPPKNVRKCQKIIFVDGENENILRSIKRRGWLSIQAAKLGSWQAPLLPGHLAERQFRRAIERQRMMWRDGTRNLSVFWIDYDKIWDKKQEIAAFLDISDPRFVNNFPARRPRASAGA